MDHVARPVSNGAKGDLDRRTWLHESTIGQSGHTLLSWLSWSRRTGVEMEKKGLLPKGKSWAKRDGFYDVLLSLLGW